MKHFYLLAFLVLHQFIPLVAQEISVHSLRNDTTWYYNIEKDMLPPPVSCRAGGSQNFRLKVSFEEITRGYMEDTIKSNKRNWTEQDKKDAEENFNKENAELLKELLEKEREDRQTDVGSDPLWDNLEEACIDELNDFYTLWDNEEYSYCIKDCPPVVEECNLYLENKGMGEANIYYR